MRMFVLTLCGLLSLSQAGLCSVEAEPESAADVNVVSAGIDNHGFRSDSAALQRLMSAQPSATFYFPPGTYLLHNDGVNQAGLRLDGFSGSIRMAKGAQFACDTVTTQAGQCVWVFGSNGATFENLTITYSDEKALPLARSNAVSNALLVENSQDLSFVNTTILGSTGSGIWNTNSSRISYSGTTRISNTSADGMHYENVADATLTNLVTSETGDDALAATVIPKVNPNCGLNANNIHIHNSHSRGIATAGACNAIFTNIIINGTANSALAATQDPSIDSRSSTNVKFSHAEITGAGALRGVPGNGYCIDIANSSDVTALDISCTGSRENGVFVYNEAKDVVVQDVMLTSPGNNGFQSANSSYVSFLNDRTTATVSNGFDIEGSSHVTLRDCRTDGAAGYGFFHSGDADLTESDLISRNSALRTGNNRAWWAEAMTGSLTVNGLSVIDDQSRPTGYIVGESSDGSQSIVVSNINFQISNGNASVQRSSSGSTFYKAGQPGPALY